LVVVVGEGWVPRIVSLVVAVVVVVVATCRRVVVVVMVRERVMIRILTWFLVLILDLG